ncbi:MAG: DinB family protein [Planctomycetes bacterium]|nr:DinB family protein [Planctomycetota bacterium]
MFTADDLLELHRRTQTSVQKAIEHCEDFAPEALHVEHAGFGYPTVLRQLHHVAGAERYWVGVLEGRMLDDEHDADFASLQALRAYRECVLSATRAAIARLSPEALATRRPMTVWGGRVVDLVPALVVLRTQTHAYQHLGQVTAMCRLLGRPVPPGLDFPLGA